MQEHESVWLDNGAAGISRTPNSNHGGIASSTAERLRLLRNDRLPGTVRQAQARLLERLRGISLAGSRSVHILFGSLTHDTMLAFICHSYVFHLHGEFRF